MVKYWNGASWVDISTEFDYAISSTNPRQLEVTPKDFLMDWSLIPYRLQPTSNLKCGGGVTGTPAVYPDDIYEVDFE
jgi:hypothetical protein